MAEKRLKDELPAQAYIQCMKCGNQWFLAVVAWDIFEGPLPTAVNVDTIVCLDCTESLGLDPLMANVLDLDIEV